MKKIILLNRYNRLKLQHRLPCYIWQKTEKKVPTKPQSNKNLKQVEMTNFITKNKTKQKDSKPVPSMIAIVIGHAAILL